MLHKSQSVKTSRQLAFNVLHGVEMEVAAS